MAALLPPLADGVAQGLADVRAAGTAQGLTDVGAPPHPSDLYDYGAIAEDQGALPATPEELAHAKATFDRDGLVVFSRGLEASAPALRAAVDALKDGSNADFRDALLAQRRSRGGAPPDFTNGAKIPWVQYEAGCEVAEPLEPGAASSDRTKPWHQDAAYFNLAADARVVGCWIALDAATPDNGCLVFERGGHARGELPHFPVRDYQLCDAEPRRDVVACPLPPGGLVLFHGRVPHGTATNASPRPRNALQLHWVASATAALVPQDAPGGCVARFAARGSPASPSFTSTLEADAAAVRVTSRSSSA
ncbi:phytanoyl-CoA dioxygenase [Aureococcus anophagefferens]|nr:phytanoyl-CoA dioxygenase [Aureococcus anophagefferens]